MFKIKHLMSKTVILAVLLALLMLLNILCGSVAIPAAQVMDILMGGDGMRPSWRYIIIESRLPQMITALLCGAALSVSGLLLQTAFRNPLAGPSVFGVSSGAGLGVAIVMLTIGGGASMSALSFGGYMAVLVAALVGALAVTLLLLLFSTMVRNNVMLLIIGVMTGYLASSVVTLLNYFATEEGVKSYMLWGMGSFSGVSLSMLPLFTIMVVIGLLMSLLLVKPLNALLLGDDYAENMGVNPLLATRWILLVTGVLTAVSTAYCGPVSFIGLAVPHIARLLTHTENHRVLLPVTMLCGGVVTLLCNLLCVLPANGSLLPLNAVTPIICAPVIIYVILKG
jgi:iron complex transport system permease protein